jgi:hypothetical protein
MLLEAHWKWAASTLAVLILGSLVVPSGRAQQPLPATTVQLPSYSYFSASSTISVPDRGGVILGGVNRARDSNTTRGFGPFANRGRASDRGASTVSVHATIIDLEELDEAVLAEAARRRGARTPSSADEADALSLGASRHAAPASVAAIRTAQSQAAETEAEAAAREAAELLAKGQQAEADGKPGVARIYYQQVLRKDSAEVARQAQSRLSSLASRPSPDATRR